MVANVGKMVGWKSVNGNEGDKLYWMIEKHFCRRNKSPNINIRFKLYITYENKGTYGDLEDVGERPACRASDSYADGEGGGGENVVEPDSELNSDKRDDDLRPKVDGSRIDDDDISEEVSCISPWHCPLNSAPTFTNCVIALGGGE